MEGIGGIVWFVGLGVGLLALAGAMVYASVRKKQTGVVGDSNNAWKEAAAESGHPEVARPDKR